MSTILDKTNCSSAFVFSILKFPLLFLSVNFTRNTSLGLSSLFPIFFQSFLYWLCPLGMEFFTIHLLVCWLSSCSQLWGVLLLLLLFFVLWVSCFSFDIGSIGFHQCPCFLDVKTYIQSNFVTRKMSTL